MKLKNILLILLIAISTCVFSGCANITCTLNLKEDGKIDMETSVLYNDKEFSYDNEAIDKIKNKLVAKGFDVAEINENGMRGFSVAKEEVNPDELISILVNEYGMDIKGSDLLDLEFGRGFLYNTYDLDSDIDLSAFSKIDMLTDGDGNAITGEELQKVFSHLGLKLVVKLDKGTILETNSKYLSDDKKTAEWILIPGTKSDIELEAITAGIMPVVGTCIIIGVMILLTVIVLTVMTRMYLKRRKECNKE